MPVNPSTNMKEAGGKTGGRIKRILTRLPLFIRYGIVKHILSKCDCNYPIGVFKSQAIFISDLAVDPYG